MECYGNSPRIPISHQDLEWFHQEIQITLHQEEVSQRLITKATNTKRVPTNGTKSTNDLRNDNKCQKGCYKDKEFTKNSNTKSINDLKKYNIKLKHTWNNIITKVYFNKYLLKKQVLCV